VFLRGVAGGDTHIGAGTRASQTVNGTDAEREIFGARTLRRVLNPKGAKLKAQVQVFAKGATR
jgi:hypothetical protein